MRFFFISLIVFFNFSSQEKLSHSLIDENIQISSRLFSELAKTPLAVYDLATLDNQAESFTSLKDVVAVQIYNEQNKILSYVNSNPELNINDFNETSDNFIKGERAFRVKIVPVKIDNNLLGHAKILFEITQSIKEIEKNKHLTFFLMLIEISISFFIAYIIGYRLTKNLNSLSIYAANIAQDEQNSNIDFSQGDEMSVLSNTLHIMEERITQRNDKLKIVVKELEEDICRRQELENRLLYAENFNKILIEGAHAIIAIIDSNGVMVSLNPFGQEFIGYTLEEICSIPYFWSRFLQPQMQDKVAEIITNAKEGRIQNSFQNSWISKDGIERMFEWSNTLILDEQSEMKYLTTIGVDITEHKKYEENLKLAASVFTHAREGIVITDAKNNIVDINHTFTRITGYESEEVIGRNPRFLRSGKQDLEFYTQMWSSLVEKGHWYGEIWNRRKNGQEYAEMLTISTILDDEERIKYFVALFSDITLAKKHEGELEHIAHYDALTGLPNRILLSDRLSHALIQTQRRNELLAVAFIDLDGFKAVNDTHGHNIGDILLVKLAERMKDVLRESDTLARLGGDEFVAILVDLEDPKDCEPVLERLLVSISEPVHIDNVIVQVSASIGISISPQNSSEGDQLMRQADQAMYQAKQLGKNRFHLFDVEKDSEIVAKYENLLRIRRALDNDEFVLYYQPKVNLQTGEIIGAEALIRWIDPQRGIIPPLEFLPIVENDSMSIEIGEWVINTALSQISTWKALGFTIPISVNVGALQLQQENFVVRLKELLSAHPEIKPNLLELEILETSVVSDLAKVTKVIDKCTELGVHFSLDDFGTGYSSLAHLRHLAVNIIKIDQTFVRNMLVDMDDLAIVEGVIGLAKAFKRDVIAEGVESIEHKEFLLQLGCKLAQGYGIARPMPASEMPQWITKWINNSFWKG